MLLLCKGSSWISFSHLWLRNLALEHHNVSACFCDIWHSLIKWRVCVCVLPFSSVWSGVHGGGVAEGVERAVEAGLQWAQNTLQHQWHQRVSFGPHTMPTLLTHCPLGHALAFVHGQTTELTVWVQRLALIFFSLSGIYYNRFSWLNMVFRYCSNEWTSR